MKRLHREFAVYSKPSMGHECKTDIGHSSGQLSGILNGLRLHGLDAWARRCKLCRLISRARWPRRLTPTATVTGRSPRRGESGDSVRTACHRRVDEGRAPLALRMAPPLRDIFLHTRGFPENPRGLSTGPVRKRPMNRALSRPPSGRRLPSYTWTGTHVVLFPRIGARRHGFSPVPRAGR